MFVCPDCRAPLEDLHCPTCDHEHGRLSGFPVLLPRDPKYRQAAEYSKAYDDIYDNRTNVWEEQGRSPAFLAFFARLLKKYGDGRYLEIGCGEGFLLQKVDAVEKHAVDLSTRALSAAQGRAPAQYSVSLAERLPYATDTFDFIAAVGVMEHFIDPKEAFAEIRRVLKPGGYFVNLVHVDLTAWERIALKISQYWFPRPRPRAFAQWLWSRRLAGRTRDLPKQPIQNRYTTRSGRSAVRDCGLVVCETLSTRHDATLPLAGPDVVVYVARK